MYVIHIGGQTSGTRGSDAPEYPTEEVSPEEYVFKRYYPENKQVTHLVTFSSKRLDMRHGPYEERYDDGTILHQGQYKLNLKEGTWIEREIEYGEYLLGQRTGIWIKRDSSNRKVSESNYVDGQLDGIVTYYDTAGEKEYEEIFEDGERISTTRDSNSLETLPMFPGCEELNGAEKKACSDRKMLEFIYRKIKYPMSARRDGAEGEALVRFVINKDGTIGSIELLRKVTKEIGQECERIIKKMPRWIPGKVGGKPARVQFNLPVKFQLE